MDKLRLKKVIGWVVTGVVVLLFLGAGVPKLAGSPLWIDAFANWGYPDWFRLVIGGLEVTGAIGLLIPQTMRYAVTLLVVIMLGAGYTHIANGEAAQLIRPLSFLALLGVILWARRPAAYSSGGMT